jgi:hypothetical protein
MGMDKQTDGQTEGRKNGRMDKRTNIYSIFRNKFSLSEGSSDYSVHVPTTLPRIRQNSNRAYEITKPRSWINQDVSRD